MMAPLILPGCTVSRLVAALLVTAALLLAVSAAGAADNRRPAPGRHLLGDELVNSLSDKTHYGFTTWGPDRWIEYLAPDGTAIYQHGDKTMFGIWTTTFDSVCFSYDDGEREPSTHIFRVFYDGKKYYYVSNDSIGESAMNIADRVVDGKADDLPPPQRHRHDVRDLRAALACTPGQGV